MFSEMAHYNIPFGNILAAKLGGAARSPAAQPAGLPVLELEERARPGGLLRAVACALCIMCSEMYACAMQHLLNKLSKT